MTDYDHGPLLTYEITWKSGHVETVRGHQVMFDSSARPFAGIFGAPQSSLPPRFYIHGEIGGQWRLVISALEADLLSIRDVTDRESIPDEAP